MVARARVHVLRGCVHAYWATSAEANVASGSRAYGVRLHAAARRWKRAAREWENSAFSPNCADLLGEPRKDALEKDLEEALTKAKKAEKAKEALEADLEKAKKDLEKATKDLEKATKAPA